MEFSSKDPQMVQDKKEKDRRPLFLIIMFALLSILCLMVTIQVWMIIGEKPVPAASVEYPVHSVFTADYHPEPLGTKVPAVKLSIIREVLQDIYFYEDKLGGELTSNASAEINNAFNHIAGIFQGSVPTATPYPSTEVAGVIETPLAETLTPVGTESTQTAPQTLTPGDGSTQEVTSVPTATNTPYVLPPYIPPGKTPTPKPLSIQVILTPSTSEVDEPGGSITYQVQVKNTYSQTVALISITDSVLGDLNGGGTCNTPANPYPGNFGAGDIYICYFNHGLSGNAGDSFANTVTVKVKDSQNRKTTKSDNALVTIKDVLPSFTVSITAGTTSVAAPGRAVKFTVRVTNTSIETVTLTQLVDDKFGDLSGKGTCTTGGTITASDVYSCSFNGNVTGTAGTTHTNTITAHISDDEGNDVSNTGSALVSITSSTPKPLTVQVNLTPNVSEVNEPGGNITYQVQVKNTYENGVALVSLSDSVLGDLDGIGTCNTAGNPYPADLASGATYICYFNLNFLGDPGDNYGNIVTAKVKDSLAREVTENDDALVTIKDVLPSLTVSKTALPASVVTPGGTVSFTVNVSNTSVEAVTLTHLMDDKFGDLNGQGTCVSPAAIAISGQYSCSFSVNVTGSAGTVHTNTVTAQISDDEGNSVSNTGAVSVAIVAPTPAEISGQVRLDADADGDLSDSDAGLQGVSIELRNGVCTPGVDCAVTASAVDGSYSFTGLYQGVYTLVSTDLANHYSTSDSAQPNDNRIPVTLLNGVNNTNNDFLDAVCGIPAPVNGYVTGTVPADTANVSYTTTQVKVQFSQLMSQSGAGSVLDAANFNNGLANLATGGVVPYSSISYDESTNTVTLTLDTTDPDWLPGSSYQINVLSGVQNRCGTSQGITVTSGFTTMSAIGGQVRFDVDGDGDMSDPDSGISGVTIELEDQICILNTDCPTMVTDANGYYLFIDLPAGKYAIYESDLPGYRSTNDINGHNFNRIPVNNLGTSQFVSGRDFLDALDCINPDPISGFVTSTSPSDGQTDVPLTQMLFFVQFNQPMSGFGSSSPGNPTNYVLWNVTTGSSVNHTSLIYDENTYIAVLGINVFSSNWLPGNEYTFTIGSGIKNSCGTSQGFDVVIDFETVPVVP